jgi:hypothetical protein
MATFGHCVVCPSVYGFLLHLLVSSNIYFTNKRYRKPRGNEKKDNPEKQDEEKKTKIQHTMC